MTTPVRPPGATAYGRGIDPSRPRLLLLSHHFPPGHGTGGARWEKFAPALVDRGWGLDVITLAPAQVDDPAWNRLERLPEHVRVFGAPQPRVWAERVESGLDAIHRAVKGFARSAASDGEAGRDADPSGGAELPGIRGIPVADLPAPWSSARALLRAYWSWMSHARQRAWAREAARRAREVVAPGRHRLVVSTGPPHLTHAAGRALARSAGLPLVLDFRDAWKVTEVLPEHLASPVWMRLAAEEETACVDEAALVVANTEPLRARMAAEYPEAAERTMTVLNGWSPPVGADVDPPERFVVAYAGAFYLDRDPRALMRAVGALARSRCLGPEELSLEFMGHTRDLGAGLRAMAAEEGVGEHLRLHPRGPRDEARRFLGSASVLVSLPQSQTLAIPSKIFDYMTLPVWIVAQTRPGSATEGLLRGTEADIVAPDDHRGLARTLTRRYDEHARRGRPEPMARDHPELRADAVVGPLLERIARWRGERTGRATRSAS